MRQNELRLACNDERDLCFGHTCTGVMSSRIKHGAERTSPLHRQT